jgi:N-acetylneuraminic acid mutarotase
VLQGPHAVVVAGGLVAGDASTSSAFRLDVVRGRARRVASLAVPVHDTAGTLSATGDVLVVGGGNATEQGVVQRFDPGADRWSVVGHLPRPRSDLTVVRNGGTLLTVGGYDGVRPAEPTVLASRYGESWTTRARLVDPVRYPATAVLDGTVWVFGGERSGRQVDTVQRLGLRSGRASLAGHLPTPLGHATAVAVGTRVLLVGGRLGNGRVTERCWWFNPATGRFSTAGRLPWPLADTAAVTVGADTYLLGGETPTLTDRVVRLHVTGLGR